jgi:cell division protein ZapA
MNGSESGVTVTVRLLGESFRIRGGSQEEVEELARFVEGKIEEIRARNAALPLRSLLILAGLNIAEELFRERKEHEGLTRAVEEQAHRLRVKLEAQIQDSSGRDS